MTEVGELLSSREYAGKVRKRCMWPDCREWTSVVEHRYWPMVYDKTVTNVSQLVCGAHANANPDEWRRMWHVPSVGEHPHSVTVRFDVQERLMLLALIKAAFMLYEDETNQQAVTRMQILNRLLTKLRKGLPVELP